MRVAIAVLWVPSVRAPGARTRVAAIAGVAAAALIAVWLVRGLRGERLGELDAYLPPRRLANVVTSPARAGNELSWILNDYDAALRRARAERRPVLLDFTGYTCTNCRWMETNMFPRPEIALQLGRFVRARLFTDGIGEPYTAQQQLQLDRFRTVALPYYVVLDSEGTPVATFLGMTRNAHEFASFLNRVPSKPVGGSR